eukprot:5108347-Pyramimonas_sp.AAC.1
MNQPFFQLWGRKPASPRGTEDYGITYPGLAYFSDCRRPGGQYATSQCAAPSKVSGSFDATVAMPVWRAQRKRACALPWLLGAQAGRP